ncbi:hypothetical protein Tco_0155871 [Tanacetum coccineum]
MPPRRTRNINDVYECIMARMEKRLNQVVDQFANRMNDMMNLRRCKDRNGQRSEDDELGNMFFEGDCSSSNEWGDYGVAGDNYEGASVFDDDYEEAPVFDGDQFKEESMSVYDTDIEDVIEEEEGFVGKGGFGEKEENMEDIVVVANDFCSSMIQTTLSIDFSKTIDSNPHELIWSQKGNLIDVSILIGKKYQEGYLKSKPMDDKLGFKTIKIPYKHRLWLVEIIMNGDEPVQTTKDENGVETEVPPKTAQAILARQKERKAKSIMLLAIPDEYQLRFHTIKDAKSLWAAIKKGLDKAYDRFQKLISQLEVHGAADSNEDANKKFLRALPSSWNNIALIMRNKKGRYVVLVEVNTAYWKFLRINMLVDKKYPLKKEILKKMINLKIEAEEESDMASELIKFIKSQIAEQS